MTQTATGSTSSSAMGLDLTQFYQVFFEEAGENLANMESLLLALDVQSPGDEDLNAIFRCAHSIKGGAATFGFQDVADLTHVMETLLDRLRRHELALTTPMVDTLLESGDALRTLLARHQGTTDEVFDGSDLVARVRALADGAAASAPAAAPAAPTTGGSTGGASAPAIASSVPAAAPAGDGERRLTVLIGPLDRPDVADQIVELFGEIADLGRIEPLDDGKPDEAGKRRFRVLTRSSDAELVDLFGFHVSREQVAITEEPATPDGEATADRCGTPAKPQAGAPAEDPGYGFFVDPKSLPAAQQAQPSVAASAPAAAPNAPAPRRSERASTLETSTLRVSVEKVDQLINLVGELVITQSMLAQTGRELDPVVYQNMASGLAELERNTRLLQEAVMAIRMIPMAVVFNRFPRMLRDLAAKLGKQIELQTIGEATELDKGVIEKITDPLTHLVRNAVDHGVELPADRVASGKPAHGTITLSAAQQGGSIVIEVRDDGRGLRRDRILAKAAERGLAVHDGMSDHDVWQLIFEPGFSTADEVTDVSGRGVGMDVVKKNIAALGGTVELDSAAGYGTRVSVRLPLTLAIMDGMSIGVAAETFIVPLSSVVESIQVEEQAIRTVGGSGRLVEVRNEYMPVVSLAELFGVPGSGTGTGTGIMIVVEAEGTRAALLVDELIGQHQVVVKNLETNYRKVPGISAATILGDGSVALILDVSYLVKRARH